MVTWQADARVLAIVRTGNAVFVGGRFTSLFDHSGASVSRSYVAAMNAGDGSPTSFQPSVNGEVNALAVSPDGSRLYIGGAFTTVNGQPRSGVAAFNAGTGALLPFQATVTGGPVNALAASSTSLYVGGGFAKVAGQPRQRLAAVDPITGQLQGWNPGPTTGGTVRVLSLPTSTRLVVGGAFTTLGGQSQAFIGALGPETGLVQSWASHPGKPVITMTAANGFVYAGTMGNQANRYNPSTGGRTWSRSGDGDVQALAVVNGTLYIGGHFNTFSGRAEPHLAAVTASNGVFVDWPARVNSELGVFSMSGSADTLYMGGDFTNVTGQDQARIAFLPES